MQALVLRKQWTPELQEAEGNAISWGDLKAPFKYQTTY